MTKTAITLEHITKTFRDQPGHHLLVLKDISFSVHQGEFFTCIGPSGSGKSTLLRIMSGLESSFEGGVRYAADVTPSDFSFVFQQFALWPWLTVYAQL